MNYAPGRRPLRRMSPLQRLRDRTGIKLFRGHEDVGNRIAVLQTHHVAGPADLARAVRQLEEIAPDRIPAKARGGAA